MTRYKEIIQLHEMMIDEKIKHKFIQKFDGYKIILEKNDEIFGSFEQNAITTYIEASGSINESKGLEMYYNADDAFDHLKAYMDKYLVCDIPSLEDIIVTINNIKKYCGERKCEHCLIDKQCSYINRFMDRNIASECSPAVWETEV